VRSSIWGGLSWVFSLMMDWVDGEGVSDGVGMSNKWVISLLEEVGNSWG
jgi:hypothetical protein